MQGRKRIELERMALDVEAFYSIPFNPSIHSPFSNDYYNRRLSFLLLYVSKEA